MAIDIKKIKLDVLVKLPLLYKVVILVGLNAVVGGLFYHFVLGSQMVEMKGLEQKLSELSKEVKDKSDIASNIPRFEREKADLEERFKKALSQLPNEKEIPNLIDSISEAAKRSGLKIMLFQPKPEVPRGFYAEVPVDMEVQGSYESIYNFCDKVGKLSRIVNISNININMAEKTGVSLDPKLGAKFSVVTFRFVSEKGQETAKETKK